MRRPEVGIIALAMLASACAFPTDSPNWDMTWNVPLPDNGQSIDVTSVLPSGISLVTTGSPPTPTAFNAQVSSVPSIVRTLGVQCPLCPSATAPKPKFTGTSPSTSITLSASTSLVSATVASGSQVVVTLTNGFSFDPINPAGGPPGDITLTISNLAVGGSLTTLGSLVISGPTQTLPPGQAKQFTIQLNANTTINMAQPITIDMTFNSPAGTTPVFMNPNQTFTAAAAPTINISQATVTIGAQTIPASTDTLDFDVPDEVINRISNDSQNRGILFLTVTNPFTIAATPTITFKTLASEPNQITPITKNITIPAATNATTASVTTLQVPLTGAELRSMAGKTLQVVFGGTTAAGTLTVTPAQKISFSQRVQLTMNIKEQK
jgi:hypothetical protein